MAPFRFDFETDQQYQARTGIKLAPQQSSAPPTTGVVTQKTVAVTPAANKISMNGGFLNIPGWVYIVFLLLAIIGFYESHRRMLMKKLSEMMKASPQLDYDIQQMPPNPSRLLSRNLDHDIYLTAIQTPSSTAMDSWVLKVYPPSVSKRRSTARLTSKPSVAVKKRSSLSSRSARVIRPAVVLVKKNSKVSVKKMPLVALHSAFGEQSS